MMPTRLACPPAQQVRLVCGVNEALIAPTAGGRVLSLSSQLASGRHDWLVPVDVTEWSADAWPKGGIFPLVPFSNRVRDSVFPWGGQSIRLDCYAGQQHALHGFAQESIWSVIDQTSERLVMEMTHPAGRRGWPWSWRARQTVSLDADGLHLAMVVINLSDTPMPLGLGFHPYFTADRVNLDAERLWVHERELASHSEVNTVGAWNKGAQTWTAFLSEWDGQCAIHWQNGLRLDMDTYGTMDHAVLHSSMGQYLCVEPVSHVCDAFNLAAAGQPGTGVQSLLPGQSAHIALGLSYSVSP